MKKVTQLSYFRYTSVERRKQVLQENVDKILLEFQYFLRLPNTYDIIMV